MALLTSIFVGMLVAAAIYQMLRRNLFDILLGIALLSHGVNVLLIAMGGWAPEQHPPVLTETLSGHPLGLGAYADPLPQALILTALVIGFGLISFLAVLLVRARESMGTLEMRNLPDDADGEDGA